MEREKRLVIELGEDLRYQFKLYCLKKKTDMKSQIILWIEAALKLEKEGK